MCSLIIRRTKIVRKTKTRRVRSRKKPKKRVDGIAFSTKFGDMISADHEILNVENESKCGRSR